MNDHDPLRALERRVTELEERVGAVCPSAEVLERPPPELLSRIEKGEPAPRILRQWRLLTQNELAEASGVGVNYISRIENGASFGLRTALKLAAALKVSVDDLAEE